MSAPHRLGRYGEEIAARHLEREGWTILARNYRLGQREVDLIAQHDELVAFVEVKTRAGDRYGHPLEAITRRKRAEIERVARAWVTRHGQPSYVYRFDAIAVWQRRGDEPVVEHIEDAWRID